MDSWLPCKDPSRLKGKEKGLDLLPAFAKASNNQIWPCIVEKVPPPKKTIFSSLCACVRAYGRTYVSFSVSVWGAVCRFFFLVSKIADRFCPCIPTLSSILFWRAIG